MLRASTNARVLWVEAWASHTTDVLRGICTVGMPYMHGTVTMSYYGAVMINGRSVSWLIVL